MLDKYIAYILFILSLIGGGYLLYHKVKDSGYKEAELVYQEKIRTYEKELAAKTTELEVTSNFLEDNRKESLKQLNLTLTDLLLEFKRSGKTTTVITKEGKCAPSADFTNVWNKAIENVNTQILNTTLK